MERSMERWKGATIYCSEWACAGGFLRGKWSENGGSASLGKDAFNRGTGRLEGELDDVEAP